MSVLRFFLFLFLSSVFSFGQAWWKNWPDYQSPSGPFNNPGNWSNGMPIENDTVYLISLGLTPPGNVSITYQPIAGIDNYACMEMRAFPGNTFGFYYPYTGFLRINHELDISTGTTFYHQAGDISVETFNLHEDASYRMLSTNPKSLTFGAPFGSFTMKENTTFDLQGGSLTAANNIVEIQATGGSPTFNQSGGTFTVNQVAMNHEGASTFNLSGGTLHLPSTGLPAGSLLVGTSEYETAPIAPATGAATFNLSGPAQITGDNVNVQLGDLGRVGHMTQSGTSSATIQRLLVGFQSEGTYDMSGGTLDISTMLAVGGDGVTAPGSGTFTQSGGDVSIVSPSFRPAQLSVGSNTTGFAPAQYKYLGGTLAADIVRIGPGSRFDQPNPVTLSAGTLAVRGTYLFQNGQILTNSLLVDGGSFAHQNGTIGIADDTVPNTWEMELRNGSLYNQFTGNLVNLGELLLQQNSTFNQIAAQQHSVRREIRLVDSTYTLDAIALDAGFLSVLGTSTFNLNGGTLSTGLVDLDGGDFHFNGGNVETPLMQVRNGRVHFDTDSTLYIDQFQISFGANDPVNVPTGRTVTLNGDVTMSRPLNVRTGASLTIGDLRLEPAGDFTSSGIFTLDALSDTAPTVNGPEFYIGNGQVNAGSISIANTDIIVEGGTLTVTGNTALSGEATFIHEAAANFQNLNFSGSSQFLPAAGSSTTANSAAFSEDSTFSFPDATLTTTGGLGVHLTTGTFSQTDGIINVGSQFSFSDASPDIVPDLSGNANLLVSGDIEIGSSANLNGSILTLGGSARVDSDLTTLLGRTNLPTATDRILLIDNSALYSRDLEVGAEGPALLTQRNTSSVILTNSLTLAPSTGNGIYDLSSGSLSSPTMTIGGNAGRGTFQQSGGTTTLTGTLINRDTLLHTGGTLNADTIVNLSDATLGTNVNANVDHLDGILRLGAGATVQDLSLAHAFAMDPPATLALDIAGPPPNPASFETLSSSQKLLLDGTLQLNFTPTAAANALPGDSWTLLTGSPVTGSFANLQVNAPGLNPDYQITLTTTTSSVTAVVSRIPLSYEDWIARYPLSEGDKDPFADPNENNLPNYAEFALNMDPSGSQPLTYDWFLGANDFLTLTLDKPPYLPLGITYEPVFTLDLTPPASAWSALSVIEDTDLVLSAILPRTPDQVPTAFGSLRITYSP